MEWWQVYLFTRLDSIWNASIFFAIASGVCTIAFTIGVTICSKQYDDLDARGYSDNGKREWLSWLTTWKNFRKISLPIFIIAAIGGLSIPTEKEFAAIYLLPKVSNSKFAAEMAKLPENITKVLNKKLENYISDTLPEKGQ